MNHLLHFRAHCQCMCACSWYFSNILASPPCIRPCTSTHDSIPAISGALLPQQAPSPRIFSPGLSLGYVVKLPNVVCSFPLGRSAPSHMSCPVCTLKIVCRWEGSVVHCVQAGKGSTLDLKISAAVNPSVVYCSNSNRSFFQPALPSISFVLLVLSCFPMTVSIPHCTHIFTGLIR